MPRTAKKPTATSSVGGSGQSAAPVTPARVQPVTVPTGLPYGEAGALADAQKQLPLPQAPGVPSPVSQQPTAAPPAIPNMAGALDAAKNDVSPGVGLGAPQRPGEVGAPSLAVPGGNLSAPDTIGALLSQLSPNSSDLQYLQAFVNAGRR